MPCRLSSLDDVTHMEWGSVKRDLDCSSRQSNSVSSVENSPNRGDVIQMTPKSGRHRIYDFADTEADHVSVDFQGASDLDEAPGTIGAEGLELARPWFRLRHRDETPVRRSPRQGESLAHTRRVEMPDGIRNPLVDEGSGSLHAPDHEASFEFLQSGTRSRTTDLELADDVVFGGDTISDIEVANTTLELVRNRDVGLRHSSIVNPRS